jgi:peptidoglycan/LPS O-acetylase OafA/YrhL
LVGTRTSGSRLSILDGLRGIAAFAVVFLHGCEIFRLPWVPRSAYLAVDFFFLLSGYVLAKAFDAKLRDGYMISFLKLRLIRLYPMIVVGSVIGLLVLLSRHVVQHSITLPELATDFVLCLFLLPTPPVFSPNWQIYPANPPIWSLFYEVVVNIIYALFAPLINNIVLVFIVGISGILLSYQIYAHNGADFSIDLFRLGFLRVTFAFFLGVLIFRYSDLHRALIQRIGNRIPERVDLFIYAAMLLLLLFGLTDCPQAIFAIFFLFPAILVSSICLRRSNGYVARIEEALGALSYPIYAIHHPLFRLLAGMSFHHGGLAVRSGLFCGSLVVVIATAACLAHYYDPAARAWL